MKQLETEKENPSVEKAISPTAANWNTRQGIDAVKQLHPIVPRSRIERISIAFIYFNGKNS